LEKLKSFLSLPSLNKLKSSEKNKFGINEFLKLKQFEKVSKILSFNQVKV
jgi:hypothetical protein